MAEAVEELCLVEVEVECESRVVKRTEGVAAVVRQWTISEERRRRMKTEGEEPGKKGKVAWGLVCLSSGGR